MLPFPKNEVPRAPEPIEDPPSGESECIKTLADVIRLIAHTLPTGSRDATVRVIASMFRKNPKADMDTDSGPMWIDTINHFLRGYPHATIPEVGAEYNRRAEENNRRLDEEERSLLVGALPVTDGSPSTAPPAEADEDAEEGPISGTI